MSETENGSVWLWSLITIFSFSLNEVALTIESLRISCDDEEDGGKEAQNIYYSFEAMPIL